MLRENSGQDLYRQSVPKREFLRPSAGGGTAVLDAPKNSLMVGKFPGCVLNLELPLEMVDVNVHPAAATALPSVLSFFRNFIRAGTL